MSGSGMIPSARPVRAAEIARDDERAAAVRFIHAKAKKVRGIGLDEVARHLTILAGDLEAEFHLDLENG